MRSAETHLMDDEHRLIRLLTPPFHSSEQDPGYIKAYPRGVRENGGQYTHAATWAVLAATKAGDSERAARWLEWLNPLNRSGDMNGVRHYRIEPYVVAGDVYGHPPFTGRGGWSWYTGSAAWLLRVALENVLGIRRRGNRLYLLPCLPEDWDNFGISLAFADATYRIDVHQPGRIDGRSTVFVEDGKRLPGTALRLMQSGHHVVQVFPNARAWNASREIGATGIDPGAQDRAFARKRRS